MKNTFIFIDNAEKEGEYRKTLEWGKGFGFEMYIQSVRLMGSFQTKQVFFCSCL